MAHRVRTDRDEWIFRESFDVGDREKSFFIESICDDPEEKWNSIFRRYGYERVTHIDPAIIGSEYPDIFSRKTS